MEHDAEGEDVCAVVEGACGDLLRRHVGGSAHDHAGLGVACGGAGFIFRAELGDLFGEAKIEHLDAALVVDHDVGGLEVAMDDSLVVRGREGVGKRVADVDDLVGGQAVSGDDAVERLALDELHGEEVDAAGLFNGVDGDNVGMVERGDGASLTLEAGEAVRVSGHGRRQHLDGYVAAQARVAGAKDLAHAAGSYGREDFVWSEFCAWRERHSLDSVQCSRSEGGQVLCYGVSGNNPRERWMAQLDMAPAAPPGTGPGAAEVTVAALWQPAAGIQPPGMSPTTP